MTTLADVNATLGVTNLALAGVSKNTEKTNEGIVDFLDYLKGKDAADRRQEIENTRETKPILKSITGGAAAIGGGLVSAGKSTFGFGKGLLSKLALPAGFVGGFLTSLLSSKLFRAGLAGLGVFFGDEIAEYLLGDDAKDEVKRAFGNVIKGASIGGFLFGKKGFIIGGALTALLQNKKVDEELGRLTTNINEFAKKIGFKDGLLGIVQRIGNAVGTGLQGLNDLAEGKVDFKSVSSTLGLLGGAAFLVSPRGSAKLAVAAGLALAKSPAGRILMALAGLAYAGSNIFGGNGSDSKAGTGGVDDAFANNIKNKSEAGKAQGGDVGGLSSYFTLDNLIGATTAAYLTKSLYDLGKGGINLFKKFSKFGKATDTATDAINVMQQANKGPGFFQTIANSLKSGASKFGMLMSRAGPIALPLAAMGGLLYVLNNKEAKEKGETDFRATKSSGITSAKGGEFFKGTAGFMEDFSTDAAGNFNYVGTSKKFKAALKDDITAGNKLAEYFQTGSTKLTGDMIDAGTVKVNSDNINTYQNSAIAIGGSGAFDIRDNLGKQIQGFGT